MSLKRRCGGRRADGRPCRGWALRDSDPPLCYAHARNAASGIRPEEQPVKRGFYSRYYTLEEIADMVDMAIDESLDDELAATRIAVRRVLQQLKKELSPDVYAHMAGLIFRGTNTVARLLKTKRSLSDELEGEFITCIGEALNGIGTEYDLDL